MKITRIFAIATLALLAALLNVFLFSACELYSEVLQGGPGLEWPQDFRPRTRSLDNDPDFTANLENESSKQQKYGEWKIQGSTVPSMVFCGFVYWSWEAPGVSYNILQRFSGTKIWSQLFDPRYPALTQSDSFNSQRAMIRSISGKTIKVNIGTRHDGYRPLDDPVKNEYTLCKDYTISDDKQNITFIGGNVPGIPYPSTWTLQP